MLMRSAVFAFSVIFKPILKSLIFIYPNLKCCRLSVSKLLIVEPLSVLSVRNKNQSSDVVLPFFIFVFKIFFQNLQGVSDLLYCQTNLAINKKSEKFWYEVNDKVWGVRGSVGGGVGVVRKCRG